MNDELMGLTVTEPGGSSWSQTNTFDTSGRLSTVASSVGTFSYTDVGAGLLVKKLAVPITAYITNQYDDVARLTNSLFQSNGGLHLDDNGYGYNEAGQRTRVNRLDGSYETVTYDADGQVESAVGSGGQSTESLGYLYDAAGNLSHRTNNGVVTTFTVNDLNELTSGPNGTGSYDGNGNLTNETSGRTFVYDDENQLVSVSAGTSYRSDFVYDGLGRLREEVDYTYSGGWVQTGATRYIYDGRNVVQERDSSNNVLVTYTRGQDLSGTFQGAGGIGGLLARTDSSGTGCYHNDGNGNVTGLVNSSYTRLALYHYDPFGNADYTYGTLASTNLYRFSSKMAHNNSGLYYYGFRFYDPNLQRWINQDPIGERPDINLYSFLGNRSLGFIDVLGLQGEVPLPSEVCEDLTRGPNRLPRIPKHPAMFDLFDLFSNWIQKKLYPPTPEQIAWDRKHELLFLRRNPNSPPIIIPARPAWHPAPPPPSLTAPPASGCSICPINAPPGVVLLPPA